MAFWSDLDPKERSAFWACFGGRALDAMEPQLYFSAVGGWMAGLLADRIGRRRLQIFPGTVGALALPETRGRELQPG